MLIAFEGIDGAGKNTLVAAVHERLAGGGAVETISFPRYVDSIHAQLADRALHGGMGDLISSAHGMATLFALDRAELRERLQAAAQPDAPEILLLDRYTASNAAYTAARLRDPEQAAWVAQLEFDVLQLPRPQLQVWLAADAALAGSRARHRAAQDPNRTLDIYEADTDLQERVVAGYRMLAEQQWASPWLVVSPQQAPADAAARIVDMVRCGR